MKKLLVIVLFLFLFTGVACYGKYFEITGTNNADIIYGKMKYKDMNFVKLKSVYSNTDDNCTGILFNVLKGTPSSAEKPYVFGKLECSSGKILELNLDMKLAGLVIDQYKNNYKFYLISKKTYKKFMKAKGQKTYAKNI